MAMSNIVIADARPTPTNHTFVPATAQLGNTPAKWFNKLTGLSSRAWETLSTLASRASSPKQEHRLNVTVSQPKVVVVDGAEVLQGEVRFYGTVIIPYGLDTIENVKEICTLGVGALANAQVLSVLRDGNPSS